MSTVKKVFGNRSNLTLHIDEDHRISLKRSVEEPANLLVAKKSKSEAGRKKKADLENQGHVTQSIVKKVKSISICEKLVEKQPVKLDVKLDFNDPKSCYTKPTDLPDDLEDYDLKQVHDSYAEPHYVMDIFKYYQTKELQSLTKKYLNNQSEITENMRAILVDWLVEIQQNYTLNHETLYLAVKMVDQYLMRQNIKKTDFQLLGATAMLIAAKYDERIPPAIEDFVYSCDNQYKKKDIILMEMEILKKLDFNIGFPLSYRFLRRYARCAELTMEELTLARFILEMSLMEYDLIEERESSIAAASLLLALRMKHFPSKDVWTKTLVYYSGYTEQQVLPLMFKLNKIISAPPKQALSSIRAKYSHRVFMEVAKINPLPSEAS
ncbi:G2/mitotic-specific cyclin-B3 [Tetranychus urticae]|uniref:Uncharacterized protein n=1 Tax=Tetranychus urticae TaxID=32264 RepID=T1KMV8_TETUR|nr:G2/mitotic-specific cyclin-B3 [Tetranychus urticae]